MDDINNSDIEILCKEFADALQGKVTWKWEDRFRIALAEFDVSISNDIQTILERFLTDTWDSANITSAPEVVQSIVKKFGGLKSGQLLFSGDTQRETFLFCAWWPWGNGNTISIRVAPSFSKQSVSDHSELIKKFRVWFAI